MQPCSHSSHAGLVGQNILKRDEEHYLLNMKISVKGASGRANIREAEEEKVCTARILSFASGFEKSMV